MHTTLETIPAATPYLWADADRVRAIGRRVGALATEDIKVGLVWAGEPRPHDPVSAAMDRRRSMRLAEFAPLARVPGIRLFSLQKGPAAIQAGKPPAGLSLVDAMASIEDLADTAALMAHLDLVITVDTAVAHLAGALGKPVWIASRFDGCWRWLLDRDDSPWYPTARLFRQRTYGDWPEVVGRIADSLADLVRSKSQGERRTPPIVGQYLR
jgi:hypothetical protein